MTAISAPLLIDELPRTNETPLEYACRLADGYASVVGDEHRRNFGQYFTPLQFACFMARLAQPAATVRRILDPGAGTGILACALCEALPGGAGPIHLDAYEPDPQLHCLCERTLRYTQRWLAPRGIQFTFTLHSSDFVLANVGAITPTLLDQIPFAHYDIAIANPPYFKLQKSDPRSAAAAAVVHGQPNMYALFLAVMAGLLKDDGIMVTITPRSFTTGDYFRRFRQYFFRMMTPEAVHLFESRTATFQQDGVLQETVILQTRKCVAPPNATVTVSISEGVRDLAQRQIHTVPLVAIVDLGSRNIVFHIPTDHVDDAIVAFVRQWPGTLHRLGLEVSTGPVVAFRATRWLRQAPDDGVAPLLWLQHVGHSSVTWPIPTLQKPQYICATAESRPLLVRNATYVVLRRFTAKEEYRRITAAPLLAGQLPGDWIGLENHLNYVYRPHGALEEDEAIGLAALLESALLDRYIRVSNGNTQVNATELRTLPLPTAPILARLGAEIQRQALGVADRERLIADLLDIPPPLWEMLYGDQHGEA